MVFQMVMIHHILNILLRECWTEALRHIYRKSYCNPNMPEVSQLNIFLIYFRIKVFSWHANITPLPPPKNYVLARPMLKVAYVLKCLQIGAIKSWKHKKNYLSESFIIYVFPTCVYHKIFLCAAKILSLLALVLPP